MIESGSAPLLNNAARAARHQRVRVALERLDLAARGRQLRRVLDLAHLPDRVAQLLRRRHEMRARSFALRDCPYFVQEQSLRGGVGEIRTSSILPSKRWNSPPIERVMNWR